MGSPRLRAAMLGATAGAAVVLAACPSAEVDVVDRAAGAEDHGYAALVNLVEGVASHPVSAAGYRAFVVEVNALRPRFNEEIGELAELYVTFLALPVLESVIDLPRAEQLDQLALTVYPTAFGVEPATGETARAYLLRLCGQVQPLGCKRYVPEGWPVVLSARARRLLKHRAEAALGQCTTCANKQVFARILRQFTEHVTFEDAFASAHESDYRRSHWPLAGPHAAPWSHAMVFALVGGDATLDGRTLPPGVWRAPLAEARAGATVLGVHLTPGNSVEHLRVIARDAAAAGYEQIALQVRAPAFPYDLGEYRIALAGRAARVDVRDIDTIQILARSLDARRVRSREPPRL